MKSEAEKLLDAGGEDRGLAGLVLKRNATAVGKVDPLGSFFL